MAQIDELIAMYLTACEVEGKTPNTVASYQASLSDFRRVGKRASLPDDIDVSQLLPFGRVAKVRAACERATVAAAPGCDRRAAVRRSRRLLIPVLVWPHWASEPYDLTESFGCVGVRTYAHGAVTRSAKEVARWRGCSIPSESAASN